MTAVDVNAFAREWIDAWNAHDLERVLSHYAEEVELVSPTAARVVPESGGVIRGKPALRAYWTKAMAAIPTLRFELEAVFASVTGATVLYRNHRGQRVTETFVWNADGLVVQTLVGHAAAGASHLYCMVAHVPADGVDAFLRYEAGVLPLLSDVGATLEHRFRGAQERGGHPGGDGDGERDRGALEPGGIVEVHVVRFPDAAALAAYRADPRRVALQPELAASGAAIELLAVERL